LKKFLENNWRWIVWGVFILFLVSIPSERLPHYPQLIDMIEIDKLLHLILFMVFTWLMMLGIQKQKGWILSEKDMVFFCVLTGTLYGGTTEIFQHFFIPGRIASWPDFIANETGCFAGWGIFKWRNGEIVK
jgi:VanZ family protein